MVEDQVTEHIDTRHSAAEHIIDVWRLKIDDVWKVCWLVSKNCGTRNEAR